MNEWRRHHLKIFRRSDNVVISSHDGNVKRTYKLKKDIVVGNVFVVVLVVPVFVRLLVRRYEIVDPFPL